MRLGAKPSRVLKKKKKNKGGGNLKFFHQSSVVDVVYDSL